MSNIHIISASAGTGKTYRLAELLAEEIGSGRVRPEAIMATTFTKKAAAELEERVRRTLFSKGLGNMAHRLSGARVGTVNSVCGRIVSDFAFEKGLFPDLNVLDENLSLSEFNRSLALAIEDTDHETLARLKERLGSFNWQEDVQALVEKARYNGFTAEDVLASKKRRIDTYFKLYDTPVAGDYDLSLRQSIDGFISNVDLGVDSTKTTATVVETVERIQKQIGIGRSIPWSEWLRLSKLKAAVKTDALLESLRESAAAHEKDPRFHEDLNQAVSLVFDVAAKALSHFQAYKRQWGVIDFADQEVLALELLQEKTVADQLADELDLLLVDEFQDTSPIQLAILLKLADLSNKTYWVGDQKQSIYGFRGTDPALMDACIDSLQKDRALETLSKSWRSRPELVGLTSDIFVQAFANHGIPENLVRIESAFTKEASGLGPIVERWILQSKNMGDDAKALAAGVRELLTDSSVLVREKKDGKARRAQPGDIGILCRTNDTCKKVAHELESLNIPAELPRMGLMKTPEAILVQAGLKLWVDPKDTLAAAELARMIYYPDKPDEWLEAILEKPGDAAFSDLPEIVKIISLAVERQQSGALSALGSVFEALDIRERCLSWGNSPARLANLEDITRHATNYADTCAAQGLGCTPAGLVAYFNSLRETDEDAYSGTTGLGAVTVITWHRAKGLEWPVTILFQLEKQFKSTPLGVSVVSDKPVFNISKPLADRWMRYWPYPYGSLTSPVLEARLEDHPATKEVVEQDLRQELRLLYVGWTRARDRLILPTRKGKLNSGILSLLSSSEGPLISEPENGNAVWAGRKIKVPVRDLVPTEAVSTSVEAGVDYQYPGPANHPPAYISPSSIEQEGCIQAPIKIGDRIGLSGAPDMNLLGEAVHTFFAADRHDLDQDTRHELANKVLKRWNTASAISTESLIKAADNLYGWINASWPEGTWHREWPIRHRLKTGSIVSGVADLVVELPEGFVVIDHKTFPGDTEAACERAKTYSGQVLAYANAIQAARRKKIIGCFIHLPISGLVIEVGEI